MTDTTVEPDQAQVVDSNWTEIDKIIAGGWNGVIERIRLTSERLIELAANVYVHRKPAMTIQEQRDSGVLSLRCDTHGEDFVNLTSGFRPPKRSDFQLPLPEFDSPFSLVRKEFPSSALLKHHIEAIDLALHITLDAVEVMTERPGMPVPTFEQLAVGTVEMARLDGIQTVVKTAASADLSSSAPAAIDFFGVGPAAAQIVNRMVPPRCVPSSATITLPRQVSIDHAVAAHLLYRFVMTSCPVYFESQVDDSYDAAATHIKNHATIAVGAIPVHAPDSLCFDHRVMEQAKTNAELVIEHAIKIGIPLDFTDSMVRFADGDELKEFRFETDIINTFFGVCGSTSLAMRATNLLLEERFTTSESFKDWCAARNRERWANDPEFQRYMPKLDKPLKPFGLPMPS